MRTPILLAATVLGIAAADAQVSSYYAERGYWTVFSGPTACRALNRPAAEFNYTPFNGLEISVKPGGSITVEVFFWPGALPTEREYKLNLVFPIRDTIVLKARSTIGDYMLASDPDPALWRALQDSTSLDVSVEGEPLLALRFYLDDIKWVLNALTVCQHVLPKE
jgi:hypothetical protein